MNDANQPQASPFKMPELPSLTDSGTSNNKNMVIAGLIILLLLAVLGINLLSVSGNILQSLTNILSPLILNILSLFGYTAGTIINKTADVAGDTTKLGVDIAEGTAHSIGDLLKNSSNPNIDTEAKKRLDDAINIANKPFIPSTGPPPPQQTSVHTVHTPEPKKEEPKKDGFSTIQGSGYNSWDYPGENQERHGYINVTDYGKSLSGQLYPSQSTIFSPLLFEVNK